MTDEHTHAPPEALGTGMVRRFGWFYRLLGLGAVLARVRFEDHSVERIRAASARGPVVYVLLERSALDHLALNSVLTRRRLPLSVWSNGAHSFPWKPIAEAWRDVFTSVRDRIRRRGSLRPVRSGWVTRQVVAGSTITVFLQDRGLSPSPERDPLHAVIEAQVASERSVQLVPVILVWDRAPEAYPGGVVRGFLLGNRESPSLFTRLRALYLPSGTGPFIQVGEPLDLTTFVRRAAPERRVDSLRTLLRRFLKREGKVVRGPQLVPRAVLKSLVLDAPAMRRTAEEIAVAESIPVESVRRRMSKEFDTVASNFAWPVIRFFSWSMRPLWTRVFSGYDIRPEDLERIRMAMRDGTAVLVPCHKSHFDYLLMSWVLFWDDLIVPHVVAGINLAIWPVHYVLRACGAFFIRRSLQGQAVHAAVFSRYLRELVHHGYTVEFFIEGGRTRTGRLMPPRPGVLEMTLDAAYSAAPGHHVTLLPVAIAYEQVAEEQSYESELRGAEKKKETMGELIKARSVLNRRFGRVFLRVGEPMRARDLLPPGWDDLDAAERKPLLREIGERVMHGVGSAMIVLPTSIVALGLMAHHRLGIRHDELLGRLHRFHALLVRTGAPQADVLEHPEAAFRHALDRYVRDGRILALGDGQDRIWQTIPAQRVLIDFHKNQVVHHLAGAAFAAAVLRAAPEAPQRPDDLLAEWTWFTGVMRREWSADPRASASDRLVAALDDLVAHGALKLGDAGYEVADEALIAEVHGLVRALIESYLLVARAAAALTTKAVEAKLVTKGLHASAEAELAAGAVTRPEAFADVALTNAISAFVEDGLLVRSPEGLRSTGPALADAAERLARLAGL